MPPVCHTKPISGFSHLTSEHIDYRAAYSERAVLCRVHTILPIRQVFAIKILRKAAQNGGCRHEGLILALRVSKLNSVIDVKLVFQVVVSFLPWACVIRLCFACWMLSNETLFPDSKLLIGD
jgi:hypothetical protein